jgi:hypothetical protein
LKSALSLLLLLHLRLELTDLIVFGAWVKLEWLWNGVVVIRVKFFEVCEKHLLFSLPTLFLNTLGALTLLQKRLKTFDLNFLLQIHLWPNTFRSKCTVLHFIILTSAFDVFELLLLRELAIFNVPHDILVLPVEGSDA